MRLSISIKTTPDGRYSPRLVLEVPRSFSIIPAGEPCTTWREAWMVAGLYREKFRSRKET
jgi:hypothetical protein